MTNKIERGSQRQKRAVLCFFKGLWAALRAARGFVLHGPSVRQNSENTF